MDSLVAVWHRFAIFYIIMQVLVALLLLFWTVVFGANLYLYASFGHAAGKNSTERSTWLVRFAAWA